MKLCVQNMAIAFEQKEILKDVSFHVQNGEFISIIGPSGCGKSTLLNVLAGLLPTKNGRVYVDDELINGISSHFSYMPQDDLLLPWKTIMDNVTLYGKLHHQKIEAQKRALKEIEKFGLQGYEQAYPNALSGGMRQRAAFLRTALCNCDIMLLDEPFGALDVITRNDMQDWLLSLRNDFKRTTLLVTHDIDEAIYLSDRILILGGHPATIIREFELPKVTRNRNWLFSQGDLKKEIFEELRGEHNVNA